MAADLIALQGESYGLIVSDCQMPGLDGYRTCIRIRQTYELHGVDQPYIVACTGNVENS